MLKLSKKTEYAVIALMDMCDHPAGERTSAKDLAEKYRIPREIMGKVLQQLAREGVIISHQGVKGGYVLARQLQDISLHTVITAVEGPIHLVECRNGDACGCDQLDYCNIRSPMELIQLELTRFFENISLEDFRIRYAGYPRLHQVSANRQNIEISN